MFKFRTISGTPVSHPKVPLMGSFYFWITNLCCCDGPSPLLENWLVDRIPCSAYKARSHHPRSHCRTCLARTCHRAGWRQLFPAYRIAQLIRRKSLQVDAISKRIFVRRAFTCYQMINLLESAPALDQPHIILNLLSTFQDDQVKPNEAGQIAYHVPVPH